MSWLPAVARRADPDPWRDRFRDSAARRDRARLEALAKELLADEQLLARQKPPLLAALGAALDAARLDAVPLLAAAQARHSDDFWLNYLLGNALNNAKRWDEAVGFYRGALALRPSAVAVRNNLGVALEDKGQVDEALQELRRAIALDPQCATPHNNLGNALADKGQRDEAMQATRRCLDLLPPNDPLRQPVTQQSQRCEQFLALDRKLATILAGTEAPASNGERLALARLCQQPFKKRYAASARLFGEAFTHDARLADDLRQSHRYNAACVAALAGCGQGEDARALPDKEVLRLRRQALGWLRADLAAYAQLAQRDDPAAKQTVRQRLEHWRQDDDLAGLRDPAALKKLPDDEREAWQALWAEVGALLRKVEER